MSETSSPRKRGPKGFFSLWCSHCETAFRGELTAYLSGKPMRCPHCHSRGHLLPWEQIRVFRPEFPRKPEYGRTYSLTRVSCR